MSKRIRHVASWIAAREWLVVVLTLAWTVVLALLMYGIGLLLGAK